MLNMDDSFEFLWATPARLERPVVFCKDDPALANFRKMRIGALLQERIDALGFQRIDVLKGPAELVVAGVHPWLIFAEQAWPHIDDSFEGSLFYTLVLQSIDFQFGCLRHPHGVCANEGSILCIDPLELHWLQPGPCAHQHWIGLQWEVPLTKVSTFESELRTAMLGWAAHDWVPPAMGAAPEEAA